MQKYNEKYIGTPGKITKPQSAFALIIKFHISLNEVIKGKTPIDITAIKNCTWVVIKNASFLSFRNCFYFLQACIKIQKSEVIQICVGVVTIKTNSLVSKPNGKESLKARRKISHLNFVCIASSS